MATKDEAQALEQVVARLQARLPDIDPSTLTEFVHAAYHEFDGAPIRDFVAILVEREAGERAAQQVA